MVTEIMLDNYTKVLDREGKLSDLDERADELCKQVWEVTWGLGGAPRMTSKLFVQTLARAAGQPAGSTCQLEFLWGQAQGP